VEDEVHTRSLTEYAPVKVSQSELEGWLWGAADILRGAVKPEKYGSYMLPLLFYKRLSDVYLEEFEEAVAKYKDEKVAREKLFHRFDIPSDCLWSEIRKVSTNLGEKLNNVLDRIAKLNPILDGVINRADFNKKEEIPEDRLIRLVEHFSKYKLGNKNVEPDVLGRAYEYLLKKFNEEAPQRAGEFYTPREVVRVLVNILDPDEGFEIYDPCSGSGGMLIVSHYYLAGKGKDPKKLFLHGQEINVDTWAISMMNVLLHDMEAEIRHGDTFADPKFLDKDGSLRKFDIVVANPMWNQDGYKQLMENDRFGRFVYGIAPKSSADWGWIQHMLASLKPTGRMGIVLDQGVLFRGGTEGEIRKKIVEDDLVECVVALPEKLFYNTGAPGCLIFFNKSKPPERKGRVIFVYAGNDYEKLQNMNRLKDEDTNKIVQAYRGFKDVKKYAKVIFIDEIRKNDHNLSVTRYVDVFGEDEKVDVKQVWDILKNLETGRMKVEEQLKTYLKELGYEQ
jgi:type I restriction enzyme M protein